MGNSSKKMVVSFQRQSNAYTFYLNPPLDPRNRSPRIQFLYECFGPGPSQRAQYTRPPVNLPTICGRLPAGEALGF